MTGHLKIAGGNESEFATDQQQVIELLEKSLQYAKSGEFSSNRVVILMVDHDVERFAQKTMHHGRALECIGFLDVARMELMRAIGVMD